MSIDISECEDCGCPVWRHNSVNHDREADRELAHCGGCGTCWKSSPEFTQAVKEYLEKNQG